MSNLSIGWPTNFTTFLARILILFIFGFAFLFIIQSSCIQNFFPNEHKNFLSFVNLNFNSPTSSISSIVFSFIVGLIFDISGIIYFKMIKFLLMGKDSTPPKNNFKNICKFLEKYPYAKDVLTLEHFYSTITRPLFSFLLFLSLFSYFTGENFSFLLFTPLLLIVSFFGLHMDNKENELTDLMK